MSRLPAVIGQIELPGLGPAEAPDIRRLIFVVFPTATAAASIAEFVRRQKVTHGLAGEPLRTDRFHISLHWIDDYRDEIPGFVLQKALAVAARSLAPPFPVSFDRALSFAGGPGRNPFVLGGERGVNELKGFQRVLGQLLEQAGLGRFNDDFTPHVTLLYDPQQLPMRAVPPISWTVDEFALVESLVGQTTYRVRGRWPLRG